MSSDLDVDDILRIGAFIVGLVLLVSGLTDLSRLGGMDIANIINILSSSGTAILKLIFGVFLIIAGLNPDAVKMIVEVFIGK